MRNELLCRRRKGRGGEALGQGAALRSFGKHAAMKSMWRLVVAVGGRRDGAHDRHSPHSSRTETAIHFSLFSSTPTGALLT